MSGFKGSYQDADAARELARRQWPVYTRPEDAAPGTTGVIAIDPAVENSALLFHAAHHPGYAAPWWPLCYEAIAINDDGQSPDSLRGGGVPPVFLNAHPELNDNFQIAHPKAWAKLYDQLKCRRCLELLRS